MGANIQSCGAGISLEISFVSGYRKDYFYASVPSEVCYNFEGEECMIVFAFCHPLPLDISAKCRNPESAICQADKLENASHSWSMGAFENYTRFYESEQSHYYKA